MTDALKDLLCKQAEHERFAAASYTALSLWCASEDYSGFASFFAKQATEEFEHMATFHTYLLDRGELPVFGPQETPKGTFEGLTEAAKVAQSLEVNNTAGITACYEAALAEKDYPSQGMLLKFIEEQVEEEAWAAKMVTLTDRLDCPGALYQLDRHIEVELGV